MPQYVDYINSTGKSFSEALILALTIWQKIVHGITMKTTSAEDEQNMGRTRCSFHCNSMNNLLSYCGLIDANIRASNKDLPVRAYQLYRFVRLNPSYLVSAQIECTAH